MLVIIVQGVVGQSESGGVRAALATVSFSYGGQRRSRCELLFPAAAAVTPTNSSIPSPSNSLWKLPVLYPRFVQAPAFYRPPLRV
jgi:hypothetical protein